MLRELGLRSEVDAQTFIACAREVEALGAQLGLTAGAAPTPDASTTAQRAELLETARLLATHLSDNAASFHTGDFYDTVCSIAYVPATQAITLVKVYLCHGNFFVNLFVHCVQGLPGSKEARGVLSRLKESALYKVSTGCTFLDRIVVDFLAQGVRLLQDWPLCSGVCPILEAAAEPPPFTNTFIGLRSPPPFATVRFYAQGCLCIPH